MLFEYSATRTFNETIDLVDIGNTAIRCIAGIYDYYMIIKTVYGKTSILTFGPTNPDFEELAEDFSVSYKKMDYKENKICKEITKYINNPYSEIERVEEIPEFEAWVNFPKIKELFENLEA